MSELVRITIYATQELKAQLEELARTSKPKTTISALGSMFLEKGINNYMLERQMRESPSTESYEEREERLARMHEWEKKAFGMSSAADGE